MFLFNLLSIFPNIRRFWAFMPLPWQKFRFSDDFMRALKI